MNIKYKLVIKDLVDFYTKHLAEIKIFRISNIISTGAILLCILTMYLLLPSSNEKSIMFYKYELIILGVLVITFNKKSTIYLAKKKLSKMYKKDKYSSLFDETNIIFNEEGIEYMTSLNKIIYKWDYVRSIHEVDDYLIIMCNEQIVIPVNCFNSHDEKTNFISFICEKTNLIVNKKFPEKFVFI